MGLPTRMLPLGVEPHTWKNHYVTDGLIAMWDGEWNAGGGVHDPSATTCTDIVGGLLMFRGQSEPMAFITNSSAQDKAVDTSGDVTIEWVWRDSGANRNCQLATYSGSSMRYRANDVRVGYSNLQITYWNGTEALQKYPMPKTIRAGSLTRNGTIVTVYGNGVSKATYSGAVDAESKTFRIFANSAFNCIRIYSRALTAAEIAANYAIDKERFNLP